MEDKVSTRWSFVAFPVRKFIVCNTVFASPKTRTKITMVKKILTSTMISIGVPCTSIDKKRIPPFKT